MGDAGYNWGVVVQHLEGLGVMVVKRIAACVLLLTLAGCYRQSEDSFSPSTGGGQSVTTPIMSPTTLPPVIEPTQETPSVGDATPTVMIIVPTDANEQPTEAGPASSDATATIVIFEPPTKVPTQDNLFSALPTATVPAIITPLIGNPPQVTLSAPTSTPAPNTVLGQTTPGASDLQPTPTDLPTDVAGECDYTIVSGDTLFRIALRNDVTLEDLLAANDLTESSIIQPGQLIKIPDCTLEGGDITVASDTPAPNTFLPTPTGVTTAAGTPGASGSSDAQLYKVKPGDTLSKIAADFGVSVQDIINANTLADPNRLSIGQELKIPK